MRVLHIIPSLKTGGAERLTLDICRELKRTGHEVKLVMFHNKNDYEYLCEDIKPVYLPVFVRPSVFKKWEVNLEPLHQLISDFKPDIIHSHLFEAEILSRENLLSGVKYFTHCHDNVPQLRNFSFNTLFKKNLLTDFYEKQHLVKKYLQCDNRFIAISKDTQRYFQSVLPEKLRKDIFLLNNAVDFKRFNAANHPRTLADIKMVNTGSFVAKKNQQFLVDVVRELVHAGKEVQLVLLGDGPLLNEVKKKISDYSLQNQIQCKGNIEDIESYLADANLYVHAATYEPFGLVLLEAMAAGLPVISLDGKGNRDVMRNNVNGFSVEKQDAKLFAEKIISVFESSEWYNQLSEGAVKTAKEFDITGYVERLVSIYRQ